ncbi:isomerase/hydrolase [Serratia marcescens]|nr:isomerase/hydrolase [Serratia marcescens]
MYQHRDWQGSLLDFPVNKVVCVGSNYADHIKEMGSAVSVEPVAIPKEFGAVHHEVELAVLIGTPLKQANEDRVARAIAGYGVALDLTLRDLQAGFKKAGQPWEKAKAFDGSCPMSGFIPVAEFGDPQNAELSLTVNDQLRQQGNTRDMITPILPLISYMSRFFTLRAGDIILTGTPQGVGPMASGDMLKISLNGKTLSTRVI